MVEVKEPCKTYNHLKEDRPVELEKAPSERNKNYFLHSPKREELSPTLRINSQEISLPYMMISL